MSPISAAVSREGSTLLSRMKLRRCRVVGKAPTVPGRGWIHGPGEVRLGHRVVLDGRTAPIEMHEMRGGRIILGDDVAIEGGASLEAPWATPPET